MMMGDVDTKHKPLPIFKLPITKAPKHDMKILSLVLLCGLSAALFAQSKVTAVSRSSQIQIALPEGSRQDIRLLVVVAAQATLQLVTDQQQVTLVGDPEVLYLPLFASPADHDQLLNRIRGAGWTITWLEGQPDHAWLLQGNRRLIMYLGSTRKEVNLYVQETVYTAPVTTTDSPSAQPNPPTTTATTPNTQPATPPAPPPATPPATKPASQAQPTPGFAFTTTNFDDGWTAVSETDWVRLTSGSFVAYIHYPKPLPDGVSGRMYVSEYWWSQVVTPRYDIQAAQRWSEMTYPPIEFISGSAVDKQTHQACYVAMNVINGGHVLVIVAPNQQLYEASFRHPRDTEKLYGYNRFAIALSDIVGEWRSSSGATANLYNVYTGASAGMAFSSSADAFIFKADHTYESKHSGAMGTVGNAQYYSQNYQGTLKMTNWDITLDHRFKDKTTAFHAYFEAIQGGRVLHLQDKEYSSMTYQLYKVK